MSLRGIMKQNKWLMVFVSKLFNIRYFNNSWKYRYTNKIKTKGAFLKKVKFNIKGKNNIIIVGHKARLNNCKITILGDNCKLIIGEGSTIISEATFWCQDDESTIEIGRDFTMEGGHLASTEGKLIKIGDDCMFSGDIEIRNGDSHSIINNDTRQRINYAKSVTIGNHVWLTAHVRILKGAFIPSNSIIGNSSVVTNKLEKENSLYSGIPCKLLKQQIDWDRNKIDHK
ncbi:hypothetical protein MPF19_14090 [Polaribacter sp. Z014]|uniref:acyltransferase n=1 Tax=Polaribacter sp. Z014 TaxID=2927126 RepID=UPI002021DBE3|nr:hypothetical protein [Polaribacter sp. Z014]MCL7764550.1 hypothetical protein [Polaribacter sp. Z014]